MQHPAAQTAATKFQEGSIEHGRKASAARGKSHGINGGGRRWYGMASLGAAAIVGEAVYNSTSAVVKKTADITVDVIEHKFSHSAGQVIREPGTRREMSCVRLLQWQLLKEESRPRRLPFACSVSSWQRHSDRRKVAIPETGYPYQFQSDKAVESIGTEDFDRTVKCLGKSTACEFFLEKRSGSR